MSQAKKKPNPTQAALLQLAASQRFVSFYQSVRVGASGQTLAAAVRAGWMMKHEYPDGSNDWSITDAGRAALSNATVPAEQQNKGDSQHG